MADHDWDSAAEEVAKWIDDGDGWVIEGVMAVRGLRQWLADNPGKALDATVILLAEPRLPLSPRQSAMAKGVQTVWNEILPDLKSRGATVIEA